ncbi:FAD:protein FMN transferase [Dactylosporangium sp. AC04546]|uniref:FAD:protein FMN transferase n=1 Tax=Dactylosporangium sp. AC04546 TaxID=2862460 RepID=UPI001EDDFDC0|nr:FAD:protein FMN transferase [Dactylosporangium sp. AC04546]WVK79838.1 FAD:protein FMN transferase [Dactylosporangium sp. AC04546]
MSTVEHLPTGEACAQWETWGTTVRLVVTDPAALADASGLVRQELAAVDVACSRFRRDTELERVYRAAGRPVVVSPLLAGLVGAALRAARDTDGDVDPTVAATLSDLGYDRDLAALTLSGRSTAASGNAGPTAARTPGPTATPTTAGHTAPPTAATTAGHVAPPTAATTAGHTAPPTAGPTAEPTAGPIAAGPTPARAAGPTVLGPAPFDLARHRVGAPGPTHFGMPAARSVDLGPGTERGERPRTVRLIVYPTADWRHVRLDGRRLTVPPGVRLDLGATAKAWTADRCARLVADTLGCGVLVSLGGDIATAGAAPAGGWRVLVQDRPGQPACTVRLPGGAAIATSSTISRRWTGAGGRPLHHIIDPRTARPAEPVWRTVTVSARTCLLANTLSTAAVVRGTAGHGWLTRQGAPARLVAADGTVLTTARWPV